MSTIPWSIKDRTLWKRLRTRYGDEAVNDMIDIWMNGFNPRARPYDFIAFYHCRDTLYDKVKPKKDYGWD